MRIPQRNYYMFKTLIEIDFININCILTFKDTLKDCFNKEILKSTKKIYTIYFICLQYNDIEELIKNNENNPLESLSIFYQDLFKLISLFISFEPKNLDKDEEEDIQQEILKYKILFDQLNNIFLEPYFIQSINNEIDYKKEDFKKKIDQNFVDNSNKIIDTIKVIINQGKFLENYNEELFTNFKEILEQWKNLYSNFNSEIYSIFIDKSNEKEIADIKKKIEKLKSEIDKELMNYPDNSLYKSLKNYLFSLKPTSENFQNAEYFIKQIISQPTRKLTDKKDIELIHFPYLLKDYKEKYNEEEEHILFNILIEYSINYKLIEDICKNRKRISSLIELEKYLEIKEIKELILKNCLISKNEEFKQELLDYFQHLLKSYLLNKILKKCQKYIIRNNIVNLLNKYMDRKNIKERDIQWADLKNKKYEPFFELIIPEFTPKDYIPLFTFKDFDGKLIKGIRLFQDDINIFFHSEEFLQNIYNINKNIENILDFIDEIFISYFNCFKKIPNLNLSRFENEFNNYKKENHYYSFIKKILDDNSIEGNYLLILQFIQEIYEANIKYNNDKDNQNLLYDDLFFLDNNWKNNITKENKIYPLVIFFLLKFEDCERELRFYLDKTERSEIKFPLFLLIFRIYSSTYSLIFQTYQNTDLSNIIEKNIPKIINETLIKNISSYSWDWCGLFIESNNLNIINPKIRYIYDYICQLSEISIKEIFQNDNNDEIIKYFENFIINFLKELIEYIINEKIEELFKKKFDELNIMTSLVNLYNALKNDLSNYKYRKFMGFSNKFLTYINDLDTQKIKIGEIVKNFKNKILVDLNEEINERRNEKYSNDYQKVKIDFTNFTTNIVNYKKLYSRLEKEINIDSIIKGNNFQERSYKIYSIYENYKKYNIFNKKNYLSFKLLDLSKINANKIIIYTDKGDFILDVKETKLLLPSYLNIRKQEIIENETKSYFKPKNENIKIYQVDEHNLNEVIEQKKNKLKEIESQDIKKINVDIPRLVINEINYYINPNNHLNFKIIDNINKLMLDISELTKKVEDKKIGNLVEQLNNIIDENKKIQNEKEIFSKLESFKKILKTIKEKIEIIKLNKPYFKDGISKPSNIEEICKKFESLKDKIVDNLDKILYFYDESEKIEIKTQKCLEYIGCKFNLQFKSNFRISKNNINFENFKVKSISSPYLTITNDNKIEFSLKSFNKIIGPYSPSLYKNKLFTFNIISFIDKNIESKLIINNECPLKHYFSISKEVSPNKSNSNYLWKLK